MTERETEYLKLTNELRIGKKIRDDAEEFIRIDAPKSEIRKILFISNLVEKYAESIIEKSAAELEKDEENVAWYMINTNAKCLNVNIKNTITRLKMHLYDYVSEKEIW